MRKSRSKETIEKCKKQANILAKMPEDYIGIQVLVVESRRSLQLGISRLVEFSHCG